MATKPYTLFILLYNIRVIPAPPPPPQKRKRKKEERKKKKRKEEKKSNGIIIELVAISLANRI